MLPSILISISDQAIGMQLAALHQHQGQLLRVVCVNGLSGYKLDSVSKVTELKDHSTAILKAVMATIGDELDSEVNYYGLIALTKLMVSLPLGKKDSHLLSFRVWKSIQNSKGLILAFLHCMLGKHSF